MLGRALGRFGGDDLDTLDQPVDVLERRTNGLEVIGGLRAQGLDRVSESA